MHHITRNPVDVSLRKRKLMDSDCLFGLESASYAQYGITHGKLPRLQSGEFSCIILSIGWPSWLFGAL
jgi:hypothetical protein